MQPATSELLEGEPCPCSLHSFVETEPYQVSNSLFPPMILNKTIRNMNRIYKYFLYRRQFIYIYIRSRTLLYGHAACTSCFFLVHSPTYFIAKFLYIYIYIWCSTIMIFVEQSLERDGDFIEWPFTCRSFSAFFQ